MDVDEEGLLYVGVLDSSTYGVFKIDVSTPTSAVLVDSYSDPAVLTSPNDVMVKGDYVYVANQTGSDGYRIIRLTKTLQFVDAFGDDAPTLPTPPQTGDFYGPTRFVAILNKRIAVMDEGPDVESGTDDRLVSFTDMTGTGWVTYGTRGTGIGQFEFLEFGE
jgi:hypothetical protein